MSQYRTRSVTAQSRRSAVETEEREQDFDTTVDLAEVRTYTYIIMMVFSPICMHGHSAMFSVASRGLLI